MMFLGYNILGGSLFECRNYFFWIEIICLKILNYIKLYLKYYEDDDGF